MGSTGWSLADSTRGATNDYLDWLHGEIPLNRWAMAHGATPNGWIGRPSHLPEERTHAFWCVSEAINFLQRRDPSAPFFLKVSFIDPHPPFTPPQFYYDRYHWQDLPSPVIGDWADPVEAPTRGIDIEMQEARSQGLELDARVMHACRAGYYGLINHVDMQISRLLQYMNDMQLLDDTLVVFVSDHGEMLGDHRLFHKSWPYEAAARVPLLVMGPPSGDYPTHVVRDEPVGLQDVMPTILDGVGLEVPDSVTGRSLMPFVRGETPSWREIAAWGAFGREEPSGNGLALHHGRADEVHLVQPVGAGTAVQHRRRPGRDAGPGGDVGTGAVARAADGATEGSAGRVCGRVAAGGGSAASADGAGDAAGRKCGGSVWRGGLASGLRTG